MIGDPGFHLVVEEEAGLLKIYGYELHTAPDRLQFKAMTVLEGKHQKALARGCCADDKHGTPVYCYVREACGHEIACYLALDDDIKFGIELSSFDRGDRISGSADISGPDRRVLTEVDIVNSENSQIGTSGFRLVNEGAAKDTRRIGGNHSYAREPRNPRVKAGQYDRGPVKCVTVFGEKDPRKSESQWTGKMSEFVEYRNVESQRINPDVIAKITAVLIQEVIKHRRSCGPLQSSWQQCHQATTKLLARNQRKFPAQQFGGWCCFRWIVGKSRGSRLKYPKCGNHENNEGTV